MKPWCLVRVAPRGWRVVIVVADLLGDKCSRVGLLCVGVDDIVFVVAL